MQYFQEVIPQTVFFLYGDVNVRIGFCDGYVPCIIRNHGIVLAAAFCFERITASRNHWTVCFAYGTLGVAINIGIDSLYIFCQIKSGIRHGI